MGKVAHYECDLCNISMGTLPYVRINTVEVSEMGKSYDEFYACETCYNKHVKGHMVCIKLAFDSYRKFWEEESN